MIRKAFGIYNDDLNEGTLFIETGRDYIACSLMDIKKDQLKAFELFTFGESEADQFEKLFADTKSFSRLLTEYGHSVHLIWSHEKAVCVPAEYFNDELVPSLLGTMHAVESNAQYSVDRSGDIVVAGYIPPATAVYAANMNITGHTHKYVNLLNAAAKHDNKQTVHVIFNQSDFMYAVYKDALLQLIQVRPYKTAEDVLYHLLNALEVFEMPSTDIEVKASGMIDDSSPLFKNLRAYFNHFVFQETETSKFSAGFADYPLHYFVSFCQ